MNTSIRAPAAPVAAVTTATTATCGGTPVPTAAAPIQTLPQSSLARRRVGGVDPDSYYNNNCVTSRRPSQCYSEISNTTANSRHINSAAAAAAAANNVNDAKNHWSSYRTDVTAASMRTPMSGSGKLRANFSFRQAQVPEGYPKMDHERNPRRESFVAEFSRKLAEGYDIWEDEDRPVINWVFPRLPIRKNKTHELRMMANRERITKMMEREKQMNKRNGRMMAATADKKETAWWERSRNGVSRTPATNAGGHAGAISSTPRAAAIPANRGWTSNVSARPSFATRGSLYGHRR